ncbi:MAG: hypothetical protein A2430_01495 [Candidatus Liptonbacteria bacterium RIFOXYC1_FULL_36_8]|uniref:DUF8128 domain-containing protein n=2 Tax=Candidatus Liptoniibacteriota TaxID=1817909 RepID=A0A1G2CS67_9BACT|nr:MAG: hypothetical protein A2604_00075 [Candidatus Liptonbacteria bacterium RIFOXYD1_FULL_36_11]OGZ04219.1 MAG: hypothetical protein A2430_01495 [Candidatus Liptonbacteria bacterium RIFOXYC1_FULL_36_8]
MESEVIKSILSSFTFSFYLTWWIILPLVLFFVFKDVWFFYIRTLFIRKIKWVILEIKVPRNILKTPKAMEQVFASLYASYSFGMSIWDRIWDGKVEPYFSFELVGNEKGIFFYVRIPDDKRNLVEAAIYSQFPDAEIEETEDYVETLPEVLPNKTYDIWGTDLIYVRDYLYPIKTYLKFEEDIDERRIDPISSITEVMSKLKDGEHLWMQYLISPTGSPSGKEIVKEGKELVESLIKGKKPKKPAGKMSQWIDGTLEFLKNLISGFWKYPEWSKKGEEKENGKEFVDLAKMTKGVRDIVEGIESKVSKLSFDTVIRFVYIDRRDSFSPMNVSATFGFFQQFSTQDMNSLKPGSTKTLYNNIWARLFPFWKKFLMNYKKRRVYDWYRTRRFGKYNKIRKEDFSILCTEELATLYHFPIEMVEAPSLRRLSSKKGEPPVGLPLK